MHDVASGIRCKKRAVIVRNVSLWSIQVHSNPNPSFGVAEIIVLPVWGRKSKLDTDFPNALLVSVAGIRIL